MNTEKLNKSIIADAPEVLTIAEFEKSYPTDKFERYDVFGIAKFKSACNAMIEKGEADALSSEEESSLNKAMEQYKSLQNVKVYDTKGGKVDMFVLEKAECKKGDEEEEEEDENGEKKEGDETKKDDKSEE